MATAEQVREAQTSIIQLTGEFARGLTVLESELRIFARISRADGRAEIANTLASLRALVQLQDELAPIAMSEPKSGGSES